jgi:N-hydroxyarylamine O-acetyltransferase
VIDELLAYIGLDRSAGLHEVHRAYAERVTFEDVAVQLSESGPLDEDALARRLLSGRGGYCFELNTVLAYILRELGHDVAYHEAVVGGEGPTNHMSLVVDGDWLADCGLGEGFMDPLPLREGRHAGRGPFSWTLEREEPDASRQREPSGRDGAWWLGQHEWGSVSGFRMNAQPSPHEAFAPHHRRLSSDPASAFVRTFLAQRPSDDRITTLRARTLSELRPEVGSKRVLDREHFGAELRGRFRLVLDDARVERLWARACAQHEEHAARAAAG